MNDNEIEELEIGLEVDNSELKESFDEAKSIIKSSINEITNILKNANIGNSLTDNVAKNLQKSIDDALKSVTKTTKNLDIKANVDAQVSKATNVEKSVSNAGSAASALGGGATLVGAQKMSVAGKDLKEGGKVVSDGADKLTDGTGDLTEGAKSLSTSSNTLNTVITGFGKVLGKLEQIFKNIQANTGVTALNKYIANAKRYKEEIESLSSKLSEAFAYEGLFDTDAEEQLKELEDVAENIHENFIQLKEMNVFENFNTAEIDRSMAELKRVIEVSKSIRNDFNKDYEELPETEIKVGSLKDLEGSAKTLNDVIDGFNQVIEKLDTIISQLKSLQAVDVPIAINEDITQKSKDNLTKAMGNVIDVDFSNLNRRVQGWIDGVIKDWEEGMADVDDSARREMSIKTDRQNRTAIGTPTKDRVLDEQAVMQVVPSLGNSLEGAIALLKVLDDINESYNRTLSSINSKDLGQILNEQFGFAVDGIEKNALNMSETLMTIAMDLGFNFKNTFEDISRYSYNLLDTMLEPGEMKSAYKKLQDVLKSDTAQIKVSINDDEVTGELSDIDDAIDELHDSADQPVKILVDNHPALDGLNRVSKEVGELRITNFFTINH